MSDSRFNSKKKHEVNHYNRISSSSNPKHRLCKSTSRPFGKRMKNYSESFQVKKTYDVGQKLQCTISSKKTTERERGRGRERIKGAKGWSARSALLPGAKRKAARWRDTEKRALDGRGPRMVTTLVSDRGGGGVYACVWGFWAGAAWAHWAVWAQSSGARFSSRMGWAYFAFAPRLNPTNLNGEVFCMTLNNRRCLSFLTLI